MDDPNENELSSYKRFLEKFCRDVEEPSSEENDSPVRHVSYMLEPSEIEGESLQRALDYLCHVHECPRGLAEQISREAFSRTELDLRPGENGSESPSTLQPTLGVELKRLQQETEVHVYKVCTEWNQQLPASVRPPHALLPVSAHAIKNTRRRMEDRHVVLPDFNRLFQLQDNPSQSYYAVFDGHGGAEAAMFAASQLHINLVRDPNFHSNPELALKRAYTATDRQFLHKAEEKKLRSGTTGVSVLMRGDHCYFAWLGDSQVLLVREGRAVKLMEPHKPHREDEKRRIEGLGGFVTNTFGVWRVNGNIAVSRAIGDASDKPYLCSDADTASLKCTGTEDYLVLACDGVWDVLAPQDIPFMVHTYLQQNPHQRQDVARHLVAKAKDAGSGDNISCIVVFFRKDVAAPVGAQLDGFQFVKENGRHQGNGSSPEASGNHQGSATSSASVAESMGLSRLSLHSASGPADSDGGIEDGEGRMFGSAVDSSGDHPLDRLNRQAAFFSPGWRSLRTGHHRQQLVDVPLQEKGGMVSSSQGRQEVDIINTCHGGNLPISFTTGSSNQGPIKTRLTSQDDRCLIHMHKREDSVSFVKYLGSNSGNSHSRSSCGLSNTSVKVSQQPSLDLSSSHLGGENANLDCQDTSSALWKLAALHKLLPQFTSHSTGSFLHSAALVTLATSLLHSDLLPQCVSQCEQCRWGLDVSV